MNSRYISTMQKSSTPMRPPRNTEKNSPTNKTVLDVRFHADFLSFQLGSTVLLSVAATRFFSIRYLVCLPCLDQNPPTIGLDRGVKQETTGAGSPTSRPLTTRSANCVSRKRSPVSGMVCVSAEPALKNIFRDASP